MWTMGGRLIHLAQAADLNVKEYLSSNSYGPDVSITANSTHSWRLVRLLRGVPSLLVHVA